MRKLAMVMGLSGWLVASLFWYGGYKVTMERDKAWDIAESMQVHLQFCQQEKSTAQSALQQGCFRIDSL